MPAVARGNGVDTVLSQTGSGDGCAYPLTTATLECSSNVRVNGTGVVRLGDTVTPHLRAGCDSRPQYLDDEALTTSSVTVRVNGRGLGRSNDYYTSDNRITSGSSNVSAGN